MEWSVRSVLIFLLVFINTGLFGQKKKQEDEKVYHVNFRYEVPTVVLASVGTQFGFAGLKAHMSESEVLNLHRNDINRFDRSVLDYPISGYQSAHTTSDWIMNGTIVAPALLFLDKEIRKDWKEFITIYLEGHEATAGIYLGSAYSVNRARPRAYKTDLPMAERSGENITNSFFSGHTSTTAVASFMMAKIYDDYHDLSYLQKAGIYSAATIPPLLVGYYRTKAGKHFRTDVLTGLGVGVLTAFVVPELHKRKNNKSLSYIPYANDQGIGLYARYIF